VVSSRMIGKSWHGDAETNAVGEFELRGVPSGTFHVAAQHPAFATAVIPWLEVDTKLGPASAEIVLSQGGRLEGWFRRRGGTVIAGSCASAYVPDQGTVGRTELRDDGSFSLEHLPAGKVRVMLEAPPGVGAEPPVKVMERDVWIREGDTTELDLSSRDVS